MDVRGNQTEMPRIGLPRRSDRTSAIVWGSAIALAVLFASGQMVTVLAAAPAAIAFHSQAGNIPWFVGFVDAIGALGFFALLGAIDLAILGGFLWLARKYWAGFAFVPPLLYLGLGSVVLWLLVGNAVAWVLTHAQP